MFGNPRRRSRTSCTAVDEGAFRGDLLARRLEDRFSLPALRPRREDVLALFSSPFGRVPLMTPELAEALLVRSRPSNVQELLAVARAAGEEERTAFH
jgi:DNA-binding NtrC family response regulator